MHGFKILVEFELLLYMLLIENLMDWTCFILLIMILWCISLCGQLEHLSIMLWGVLIICAKNMGVW